MELIKVRCPQCNKLFSVKESEIAVTEPRFRCDECRASFAFHYPVLSTAAEANSYLLPVSPSMAATKKIAQANRQQALEQKCSSRQDLTAPNETKKLPSFELDHLQWEPSRAKSRSPSRAAKKESRRWTEREKKRFCPRCEHPFEPQEKECARCGVVFAKVKVKPERRRPEDKRGIVDSWQAVLASFDDEVRHQIFIDQCVEHGRLLFAFKKYKLIVEAEPENAMAARMLKRVEALQEAKVSLMDVPSSYRWVNYLAAGGTIVCALMIVIGLILPAWRNLIGLGSALFFLIWGVKLLLA